METKMETKMETNFDFGDARDKEIVKNIYCHDNYECMNMNETVEYSVSLSLANTEVTMANAKYICPICSKRYRSRNGLWLHCRKKCQHPVRGQSVTSRVTVAKKTSFNCSFCEKGYESRNGLWKHLQKCGLKKPIETCYVCINCDKIYKTRNGLWKHSHKCKKDLTNNEKFMDLLTTVVADTIESRKDMKDIIQSGNVGNTTTNNNNNTNNTMFNNSPFNLNFYLNETCKNAMNLSEFVDQLNVTLSDLEETGRLGYARGISQIIVKGLQKIEVIDRPLHCSDAKRETIYYKENNEWKKDTDEKSNVQKMIKEVGKKNISQIQEFHKRYPDCNESSNKMNNRYLRIVSNAMCGGSDEEITDNLSKIIRNIVKEVVIDKANSLNVET
jgi:hypothetical protein